MARPGLDVPGAIRQGALAAGGLEHDVHAEIGPRHVARVGIEHQPRFPGEADEAFALGPADQRQVGADLGVEGDATADEHIHAEAAGEHDQRFGPHQEVHLPYAEIGGELVKYGLVVVKLDLYFVQIGIIQVPQLRIGNAHFKINLILSPANLRRCDHSRNFLAQIPDYHLILSGSAGQHDIFPFDLF